MDAILSAEVEKGLAETGLSPPGVIRLLYAAGGARQRISFLADTSSAQIEVQEMSRALEEGAGPDAYQTGPPQS